MSTAPMCSASWLQCPQSLKSRELCQPALICNPISSMPVYLTAVFPKYREEGRMSISKTSQLCAAVFQISVEEGWVHCKPVHCYLQRGQELHQCIMQHLFLQASGISQKAWMAQLLQCILFHLRSFFFPNCQLNGGACFYELEPSCQNNLLSDLCVCWHQGRHLLLTDAQVGKPILADTVSQRQ